MREMKDSGISWIGLVPYDWKIMRLKYVSDFYNGDRGSNYPSGDDLVEEGIPFLTSNNIHGETLDVSDEITKYITQEKYDSLGGAKVMKNDIIFCLRGSVGTCAINKSIDEGTVASSLVDIRPKKIDPNFLNYVLNSPLAEIQTLDFMNGSCALNLSAENVSSYVIFVPSISEQHLISTYLDAKCSEIDALTADIQSQIDTLEQYKRSVITEAVTKGLDKDVEMNESGIPFIGAIPAHWKSDKLKYHLQRNEPRNPGEQEVLSLYRDYGIVPKDSRDDNFNVTSEDTTNYKYVRVGDFVINKMKAWQGSVAVSDYEGIVSPAYYVYKFTDDNIYRRYFHYLLRACYKDEFMRLSGGIRVGQWDLSATALENTYILLPPYEEQVRIADYLDDKKKDIDDAIASKHDQLATLDAYKKSTIYEYVTGKKEVPAV